MLQRYELSDARFLIDVGLTDQKVIFVRPAAGCTIRVELSHDGVKFYPWLAGDVSVDTERSLELPFSIVRFTRIAGSGVGSFVGVV